MDADRRRRLSKFLAYVLRHQPASAGLTLDPRGCAPLEAVRLAAETALKTTVPREELEQLAGPVTGEAKRRFEIEGDFIRAGHGHSVPISDYEVVVPKAALYHGTVRAALEPILSDGLKAMSRDKVHLAYDRTITLEAARRKHRDVVLIEVDVERALAASVRFYRSADPRVVLADDVPPAALRYSDSLQA